MESWQCWQETDINRNMGNKSKIRSTKVRTDSDVTFAPYIDLFCGAGGMSIGLELAGLECVLAIDINELAVKNYNNYFKKERAINGDIRLITKEEIRRLVKERNADIDKIFGVVGGPPCQGFSLEGHRNVMDDRNSLVGEFIRIVEEVRPCYFLMENVTGILSMTLPNAIEGAKDELVIDWIDKKIKSIGYNYKRSIVRSHQHGDPQKRNRVIFAGWRSDVIPLQFPPKATHSETPFVDLFGIRTNRVRTVRDAFALIDRKWTCPACNETTVHDLIELRSHGTRAKCTSCGIEWEIPDESARNNVLVYMSKPDFIERIKSVKPGASLYDNFSSSYKRLFYDKPAPTTKENHGAMFFHPVEDRMISIREMASLQSFPQDYTFIGSGKEIIKLIGNAVPCCMAKELGKMMMRTLEQSHSDH